MEDLANEVISKMKMEDRPSKFVLTAMGRTFKSSHFTHRYPQFTVDLKVTAPVERGSISFDISFLEERTSSDWSWETVRYSGDDWEGAVAFIDGFMNSGEGNGGLKRLELFRCDDDDETYTQAIASWQWDDDRATNLAQIRGAVKALLGY